MFSGNKGKIQRLLFLDLLTKGYDGSTATAVKCNPDGLILDKKGNSLLENVPSSAKLVPVILLRSTDRILSHSTTESY